MLTTSGKPVKNMTKKQIQIFFERLRAQRPNPKTELNYSSPFELLVAVTLSAQATDVSVNKATDKLFPVANTPETIYALGVDGLKTYIKTIGLYNAKAENVIKACKILIEKHNSIVPNNRADLEALPGVGRKTANVVLNTAFGQPTMAVDTHIFRLGNRTGLILHGRYCCIARKPKCHECIVSDVCNWPDRFEFGAARIATKTIIEAEH